MAKDKRSFFERLTGTVNVEDEFDDDMFEQPESARYGDEHGEVLQPVGPQESEPEPEEQEGQLAVDVFNTPDSIVIKAIVAGVRPDDLDVSITRDMVTIRGTRSTEQSVEDDNYYYQELFWGSFSRTIVLPEEVEVEAAEAKERHGLLEITLPKIDKDKQTKLKIKSN